jgi:hypothetical protein
MASVIGAPVHAGERVAASPSGISVDCCGATSIENSTYVSIGAQSPDPSFRAAAARLLEIARRRAAQR